MEKSGSRDPANLGGWLSGRREKLAISLLLLSTFALAAGSAAQKSVTVDEYQALPHGLAILKTGDLHLATGVPLLPSVLPALPLLATEAKFDAAALRRYTSSWQCGRQFVLENGFDRDLQTGEYLPSGRYHDYFLLGRLISIALLLVTCGLAYGYARDLYGRPSGLVALVVACFSPNLLAHGRHVPPYVYIAAAILGSLWAFGRLTAQPGLRRAILLGLAIGIATLCKLTGLLLFVLVPVGWLWFWLADRRRLAASPAPDQPEAPARNSSGLASLTLRVGRRAVRAPIENPGWRIVFVTIVVGLLVINAGYLFEGTFPSLRQFQFESGQMRSMAAILPGWLPIPLPRFFFQGIDTQLAESGYTAYLMGRFNSTGFYSYYLVALLVKTPVPVLALCVLACFWGGWPTRREAPLIATAVLFLLFFSLSRHKNIGLRYVLFLEPLMAVWISRLLVAPAWRAAWLRRAFATALVLLVAITLTSWPHYLPYFNWLSGGPDHGHRWLLDSNLDWGQDLIALKRYMDREHIHEIDLAHFGRVPPAVYGIRYRTLRAGQKPVNRHVAVSANLLWGLMYIVNGDLNDWPGDADSYRAYRELRPKAVLGHSIYVYEVD